MDDDDDDDDDDDVGVHSMENKKILTMGTMYQDLSTRYKQRADVYP